MKKLFLLLIAVLSIGLAASAQTRTVTGTVYSGEDNEPLVGASVLPYGEKMGVSTDVDGNFVITVPASVTKLTFAYVGMTPQDVKIPENNKMIVHLSSNNNVLDEVMVVAYGTVKKAAYTGSASVVKADQLESAMVSNVTNALSGKMAGVQVQSSNGAPGQSSTVRIRGVGSINASSSPLYVVDGMPYDGDINMIPNSDIESLTVLKDAASTALYGARGANGVILITTKSGQQGNAKVTVDMNWGSNSRAVPQYDVITDPRQYLETTYQSIKNTAMYYQGMDEATAHNYANANIWKTLSYQTWTIPDGEDVFGRNGKFNPNATPGYSNGRYYFIADDWTNETLIHGLRQQYQVNVQGGTDKINYYVSGSYLEDEGIIKNSHFNRLSTRTAIDYKAKKWLKVGTNMSYTYTNTAYPGDQDLDASTSSGNAFYFANSLGPVYPFYIRDVDGNIMYNQTYNNPIYDYGDGRDYGNGPVGFTRSPGGNPVGGLTYDTNEYLVDALDGKWYAVVNPLDGLNITGNVGYHVSNERGHVIQNGVYGQFAPAGGYATQSSSRVRSLQTQLLGQYSHTFAEKHDVDVLVGYEYQNLQVEYVGGSGANLYNPTNFTLDNTIDQKNPSGYQGNLCHIGYLGRLTYSFDERYFFMGSIRRDGSSRFAKNHRWGTFWSASAGWNINNEAFMRDATWLDLLKFKVSFGQNGNDGIGSPYLKDSSYYIAYADQYAMTGANGVFSDATLSYKGNPDITWETSNSFNTGFDFAMWNGKLQGTLEYFSRQTSNMLFNIPVAPSLGYSSIPMNVGKMRNNGVELDLNYTAFQNRNITIDLNANITLPSNKVIKLDPSILNTDVDGDGNGDMWVTGNRVFKEGESMYQLYLVKWGGVDPETGYAQYWAKAQTEGVVDDNGNEVAVGAEYLTKNYQSARNTNRQMMGNMMPKGYGGFGVDIKAYGFDLSASFAYQFGGKILDYSYQNFMQAGSNSGSNWHKDILNAWTPENRYTDVPRLYIADQYAYANSLSDRFFISSNYLSLNNVTIGYTLPKKLAQKLYLTKVRVYGAAENVALWSKRKGLDPRQGFVSSENYTYSPIRTITGGLTVEF